jgi:hypothetical protein
MSGKIRARTLKRILVGALLALFVPIMAHATSSNLCCSIPGIITITNTDGNGGTSAVGVMGPFSLTGSEVSFIGIFTQGNLPGGSGSLSFTTGAYLGGSLMNGGAQWSGTGSTFTITGYWNGNTGTIFTGEFSGNVSWVFNGCTKGTCDYELTGPVTGQWINGTMVYGQTTQIFFKFKGLYNGGSGLVDTGGQTSLVTPEPNSLGMMGAGLLVVGFVVKRKGKDKASK